MKYGMYSRQINHIVLEKKIRFLSHVFKTLDNILCNSVVKVSVLLSEPLDLKVGLGSCYEIEVKFSLNKACCSISQQFFCSGCDGYFILHLSVTRIAVTGFVWQALENHRCFQKWLYFQKAMHSLLSAQLYSFLNCAAKCTNISWWGKGRGGHSLCCLRACRKQNQTKPLPLFIAFAKQLLRTLEMILMRNKHKL